MAQQENTKSWAGTYNSRLKWICITAISTALFVVLTMCLQVPVHPHGVYRGGFVFFEVLVVPLSPYPDIPNIVFFHSISPPLPTL